ncbi:MAG TPA: diguanylate cyclase [Tahibacter sp.]|uniref:diguanylate cyclase domain-containing protein n=1 Tax=Tahibacter sp. TaxID=2056211 RepID=UPI002D02C9B2|nr:diguanylate cyclase [Tahibacter sp.]HSX62165.1 diguanylate cyclase [Tahibacter sp.]
MTTRPSVLIIDDEPANVRVLAEALQGAYDLRFATDGERALALVARHAVDLILLDVVMPGLDGFELLRRLKAEPATREIPVIFVTARDEIGEEERGFDAGAVDYITKPVSPAIVRARVRTHLELKRQRDLLEQRALIDGLTGIANRRRFDEEWLRRAARAYEHGLVLRLLLIDIDHFKDYNDHYGHGPGDDCLRRVAAALHAACGHPGDLTARYGGEEFVAILADAPDGDAAMHAQRLLAAVRDLDLPHARSGTSTRVSISIGAIERAPAGRDGRDLLESADRLLYEAKRGGRNRCVIAGADGAAVRVLQGEEPS